jgi:hypothetical protein
MTGTTAAYAAAMTETGRPVTGPPGTRGDRSDVDGYGSER